MVGYGNECNVQECGQPCVMVMSSVQEWDMVMSVVYKSVVSGGIW